MEQVMKEEEKLRVLNLLMWLQVSIYASDDCESIKWFYNHRTKQSLKQAIDAITKEHGKTIMAMWDADGVQMPLVTETMDKFAKLIAEMDYYRLPDIVFLLELYNQGKLETLLKFHQKLQEHDR
jgi:hypothetical protein